jgi:hypothetical protein
VWPEVDFVFSAYDLSGTSAVKSSKPVPLALPTKCKRNLSYIIDTMASGGIPCAVPNGVPSHSEPKEIEVRPGTFYYKGLFLWDKDKAWVVAPNIFSPTRWSR